MSPAPSLKGKDNAMFRKCIITFAALATLGVAALASGPASARWGGHGGGGHWGGGHWGGGHWGGHLAFHHPHFFVRERFAFRHPFFFRRHFALLDDGCWRVHRALTPWGWRWHRVWVCG
jgi:hypothetical protein